MMDYYETLGVQRQADEDEIRQAYKKLALRHHPDRGGDEEEFKKIGEAYAVLSDKDKKSMYDRKGGQMNIHIDVMDIFNNFFGGFKTVKKSPDRSITLPVTLEEIMSGKNIMFRLKRKRLRHPPAPCILCNGSGTCYTDTRIGFIMTRTSYVCRECIGVGYRLKEDDFVVEEEIITIPVAPGACDGQKYLMEKMSDELPGCENGDVYIIIEYQKHKRFKISEGSRLDLVWETEINLLEFLTGFERVLKTLDGKHIRIVMPPGELLPSFQPVKHLPGLGLVHKDIRGNIIIMFRVRIPKQMPSHIIRPIQEALSEIQDKEIDNMDKIDMEISLTAQ
jgi:DnaJ-class molecular chaperone